MVPSGTAATCQIGLGDCVAVSGGLRRQKSPSASQLLALLAAVQSAGQLSGAPRGRRIGGAGSGMPQPHLPCWLIRQPESANPSNVRAPRPFSSDEASGYASL